MLMQQKQKSKKEKGFTLLLAALFASIALLLGSSIYSIVSKELTLSSIGQDSQYAFYAADTAAECALYWDSRTDEHPNTFATSSASQGTASAITCDTVSAPLTIASSNANAATTTLEINSLFMTNGAGGYCADVTVSKTQTGTSSAEHTLITANGYSVSCAAIGTAPDALQRTVQLQY